MTHHGEPAATRFTSVLLVFGLGSLACSTGCPATDSLDPVDTAVSCDAPERWFRDGDADGYGDAESEQSACNQPQGYVADESDCDDGAATTYPGALDACDGVDDDCDGEDENCLFNPWDSLDGVLLGEPRDGTGFLEPTGSGAIWVGVDGYSSEGYPQHGRIYLWEGPVVGEQEIATESARIVSGVPGEDDPTAKRPMPWGEGGLTFSSVLGPTALTADSDVPVLTLRYSADLGNFYLRAVGDLVGDGVADDLLSISCLGVDGDFPPEVGLVVYGTQRGEIYVGQEDARVEIREEHMSFTDVDIAKDLDGDGIDEVVVLDYQPNVVRLYRGPVLGDYSVAAADVRFASVWKGSVGPYSLEAGDVDGDGLPELVLSPYTFEIEESSPLLVYKATSEVRGQQERLDALAQVESASLEGGGYGFSSYAGAGDFQGDGFADLVVPSYLVGDEDSGSLWVVPGPFSGVIDEVESDPHILLDREVLTKAVTDLDGDGLGDLLLADFDNSGSGYGSDAPRSRVEYISGSSLSLLIP